MSKAERSTRVKSKSRRGDPYHSSKSNKREENEREDNNQKGYLEQNTSRNLFQSFTNWATSFITFKPNSSSSSNNSNGNHKVEIEDISSDSSESEEEKPKEESERKRDASFKSPQQKNTIGMRRTPNSNQNSVVSNSKQGTMSAEDEKTVQDLVQRGVIPPSVFSPTTVPIVNVLYPSPYHNQPVSFSPFAAMRPIQFDTFQQNQQSSPFVSNSVPLSSTPFSSHKQLNLNNGRESFQNENSNGTPLFKKNKRALSPQKENSPQNNSSLIEAPKANKRIRESGPIQASETAKRILSLVDSMTGGSSLSDARRPKLPRIYKGTRVLTPGRSTANKVVTPARSQEEAPPLTDLTSSPFKGPSKLVLSSKSGSRRVPTPYARKERLFQQVNSNDFEEDEKEEKEDDEEDEELEVRKRSKPQKKNQQLQIEEKPQEQSKVVKTIPTFDQVEEKTENNKKQAETKESPFTFFAQDKEKQNQEEKTPLFEDNKKINNSSVTPYPNVTSSSSSSTPFTFTSSSTPSTTTTPFSFPLVSPTSTSSSSSSTSSSALPFSFPHSSSSSSATSSLFPSPSPATSAPQINKPVVFSTYRPSTAKKPAEADSLEPTEEFYQGSDDDDDDGSGSDDESTPKKKKDSGKIDFNAPPANDSAPFQFNTKQTFSFAVPVSTEATTEPVSPFSFTSASSASSAPSFASSASISSSSSVLPPTPSSTPALSFLTTPSSSSALSTSASSTAPPSSSLFNFGSAASSSSTPAPFAFGLVSSSSSTTPSFSFPSTSTASNEEVSTKPLFNEKQPEFTFGSSNPPASSSAPSSTFVFGSTPNPIEASAPTPISSTFSNPSPFVFGSTETKPHDSSMDSDVQAPSSFAFGQTTPSTFPFTSSNAAAPFGSSAPSTSAPFAFGTPSSAPSFSFGGPVASSASTMDSTSPFGAANSSPPSFTFGATAPSVPFGSSVAPTPFGAPSGAPFGNSASASPFGSANSTFGSGITAAPFGSSPFGAPSASPTPSFTFGAPNPTPTPPSFTFGAPAGSPSIGMDSLQSSGQGMFQMGAGNGERRKPLKAKRTRGK
eukprot:TRINITY_DN4765_c0_g1_i1.p1 TRINITY_DN4765_c0_g1~~TRINITY_DN4765_c0_g1_i1.p1  ORF type:complete len:1063 (-),score=341.50 TRINITY_DN4765_c0_g1_i1:114-3302(-)